MAVSLLPSLPVQTPPLMFPARQDIFLLLKFFSYTSTHTFSVSPEKQGDSSISCANRKKA